MNTPTTITYWSWATISPQAVRNFEAKYPKIKVDLVNVGAGPVEYQKLRTALKAGSGAPDAAFMEDSEIPSFRLTKNILNLAPYGFGSLQPEYLASSWAGISGNSGIWGLPNGGDALVSLYRKDLLAQAGISSPPSTWAQFAEDAAAVKAKTGVAMANLAPGDDSVFFGLLQQAGQNPLTYDGSRGVGINLDSAGARQVVSFWQGLIQKRDVSTDADFASDWYAGIANGKYASIQIGPWGPGVLTSTSAASNGKWEAAPLPDWTAGGPADGTWASGTADVVLSSTKHPIVAAQFVKFINTNVATANAGMKLGQFPPLKSVSESPAFLDLTYAFTGKQQVNKVAVAEAQDVVTAQGFVPFNDYVESTYTSIFGQALTSGGNLLAALKTWQQTLVNYAKQQGFTVSS